MRFRLGRWSLPAAALLTSGLVLGTLAAPAGADDGSGPLAPAASADPAESAPAAEAALEEVQELLAPAPSHARRAPSSPKVRPSRDLTLAMRELTVRQQDLSAADQATAAALLDRPAATRCRVFGGKVAVHWTTTGSNASTGAWVTNVGNTAVSVLARYAAAGYRAPKSDGTRGNATGCSGNRSYLDVYLRNLGPEQTYGYCNTDQPPNRDGKGPYDRWAFCAFDNNFAEFPGQTPDNNLKVTVAHELFHAVQFAYDYLEDIWFMESTATWAEDELYTTINDNRQYLRFGPSSLPAVPLDNADAANGLHRYGTWLFFRYLSERFPQKAGGMPAVIRRLWARADSTAGARDAYSTQAIAQELRSRKDNLRNFLARFADANRHPGRSYREGRAYPRAKAAVALRLSKGKRDSRWRSIKRNHLSAGTVTVVPGKGLRGKWRLRADVNLPPTSRGSAAVVTVYLRNGKMATKLVRLGRQGNGKRAVSFDARKVARVDLTLSNGGARFKCWRNQPLSCAGTSLDNGRKLAYRLRVVR